MTRSRHEPSHLFGVVVESSSVTSLLDSLFPKFVDMSTDDEAQNVRERTRRAVGKTPAHKLAGGRPPERRGVPRTGRIVTLLIGQGHGFIRLANDREVFFHRSDVLEGVSFNDFAVGDAVQFDLLEDDVSGPRAVQVVRRSRR